MATLPGDAFFGAFPGDAPTRDFFAARVMETEGDRPSDATSLGSRERVLTALNEVRKEAADLIARTNLRIELADAVSLDDLTEIKQRFDATRAVHAKALFGDPAEGQRWAQAGDQAATSLIDATAAKLKLEHEGESLDGLLQRLSQSALQISGPDTVGLIDAGSNLIDSAQAAGYIDTATAKAKREHWVQSYATAWTEMRPPEERLALLGGGPLGGTTASETGEATDGISRDTGTPVDFVPAEDRDRIRRAAQVEIERARTQRLWQRSQHHSQTIEQALLGAAPPSRVGIELDPDLDELSRARLLRQHATMERDLAAYAEFKTRFDNPAGAVFNVDASDRDLADKTYQRLGANPAALHAVVSRTGILPSSALVRMQGDLASDDPARVMQAVNLATRLGRDHPKLLALEDSSEDVQNAVAQFRHYIAQGAAPDQAIRRIIQFQSSEYQTAWAAQRRSIDLDAAVANAVSPADLAQLPRTDPLVTAVAHVVYPELVKERFEAIGDIALAKAQAREQLELLARAVDEEDGGAGSSSNGGGGDAPNEAVDWIPPESERPKTRITVWPRWVILPDAGQSDGSERPVASHQEAASASENVEALRAEPPVDELEELAPQPKPASDLVGTEPPSPEQSAPPPPPRSAETASVQAEIEQPAPAQPESPSNPKNVSLEDRENLSAANARFRGTIHGAAELNQWATTAQWLAANPDATDEQLLGEFRPGLLRIGWAERRQATVDYLRDAPRLYNEARANLDRYDAMPAASTAAEFLALGRGELYAAATSYDTLIGGGGVRGATWLLRGLKMMLREAGTTATTDSIKQWQNIEAGVQERFDAWPTAVSVGIASLFGAARNAGIDVTRLGSKAKSFSGTTKQSPKIKRYKSDRKAYFEMNPGARDKVSQVHHSYEWQKIKKYPGAISEREIRRPENLRGILKGKEREHLSGIRLFWNKIYGRYKTATRRQIRIWRDKSDVEFRKVFYRPKGKKK